MTVLLDTHAVFWWSTTPELLGDAALAAIEAADDLAVSGVTWFELAWLVRRQRIVIALPVSTWLHELAAEVRTVGISWHVADVAADLPDSFPRDAADRIIYATPLVNGWPLVTKDGKLRGHRPRDITVW